MAAKRITMQDIADACGLSRNTVSKIFNGRGAVPDTTRKLVLAKAQELGYGQFPEGDSPVMEEGEYKIALLTQHKLLSHNFGAYFITSFTDYVCRANYTIKMYEISAEEIAAKALPPHLNLQETTGILCIELFDRAYQDMICSLGIPCVFVDGYARINKSLLNCDFITMENYAATIALTQRLIDGGAKRIGFVGDKEHCNSFFERWEGFSTALEDSGLFLDPRVCILDKDSADYGNIEYLLQRLSAMPYIPEAFVCANDFLAIHLMTALKKMGLRIPEDVMLTGFDGSPESSLVEPPLTTARIVSTDIGRISANILLDRIQNPQHPYRWMSVQTIPVWGGTTR